MAFKLKIINSKKRTFIPIGNEPIFFNKANNKTHEWYWDYKLGFELNRELAVSLTISEINRPEKLDIILTYLDTSKELHPSSSFEFITKFSYKITENMQTKYPIMAPIKVIIDSKLLWNVCFRVRSTKAETILYLTL